MGQQRRRSPGGMREQEASAREGCFHPILLSISIWLWLQRHLVIAMAMTPLGGSKDKGGRIKRLDKMTCDCDGDGDCNGNGDT